MKPLLTIVAIAAVATGIFFATRSGPKRADEAAPKKGDGNEVAEAPRPRLPDKPNFNEHIAPLIHDKCVTCHRTGQVAPFTLITYDDVQKRAQQLVEVTKSGYMPPFLPDPKVTRYKNARYLHDDEVAMLDRWVKQGCEQGPGEPPEPPTFRSDWQLGKPDIVVSMDEEYTLPAEGDNVFRHFVLPLPNKQLRYIKGFEFRTTNPRVVHHARFLFDSTSQSRILDEADPEPGFAVGMGVGSSRDPDGHWLGWTPGKQPVFREEKYAWPLEPEQDLIIELHMLPTGKPEPLKCEFALYYSKTRPTDLPVIIRMGPSTIDIEPDEKTYSHAEEFQVPVDIDLLNVYPHAHLLAKRMVSHARLPGGKKVCLLDIAEWDFNWQDEYQYAQPIRLPAGSVIEMEFVYDNSEDNVRNPHSPPKRVLQGSNTDDEMGDLWFQMVPVQRKNRMQLQHAVHRREALWVFREAKFLAEVTPNNAAARSTYGMILAETGKLEEARGHFLAALKLEPDSAPILNNVSVVELQSGNNEKAAAYLTRALKISPDYPEALKNLGLVRFNLEQYDRSIVAMRKFVQLNSSDVQAWCCLGRAYMETKRLDAARKCADFALQLNPNSQMAMQLRVELRNRR